MDVKPELVLSHSTRNQLIVTLNDLSAILQSTKSIPEDAKQRTRQKINDSMLVLLGISPFKPADQSTANSSPHNSSHSSDVFEEMLSDQLIVQVPEAEQSEILNHLMAIKEAVLSGDLSVGETKLNLMTENRRIIGYLLNLPCTERGDTAPDTASDTTPDTAFDTASDSAFDTASNTVSDTNCGTKRATNDIENENNDEPSAKKLKSRQSQSSHSNCSAKFLILILILPLCLAFQNLDSKAKTDPTKDDQLRTLIKQQSKQILRLELQIDELKRAIKQVDTSRSEASFQFELTGISRFLEIDGNERCSKLFWCTNLQWSLYAKCSVHFDLSKHLGLYLYRHNDEPIKWPFKLDYKLILFNQLTAENSARHRVTAYSGTFEKNTKKRGFGLLRLISYTELIDPNNGFIKNDKVVLGVEMKAIPVVRD